jgi:D-serine deaminase-like pyridoxal phosphate-dependent protein
MIARLLALNETSDGLIVVVDDLRNVDALSAAIGGRRRLGILVEIDVGQGRTGVVGGDNFLALVRRVAATPQLVFRGVQAYYGHFQHIPTIAERRKATEPRLAEIRQLVARLRDEGLPPEIVTGSGTGTFETDATAGVFTEFQAGSYPFMDRQYAEIERGTAADLGFEPALFVHATVVNASRPGFVVVNAGFKSFATEGGPPISGIYTSGAVYQVKSRNKDAIRGVFTRREHFAWNRTQKITLGRDGPPG